MTISHQCVNISTVQQIYTGQWQCEFRRFFYLFPQQILFNIFFDLSVYLNKNFPMQGSPKIKTNHIKIGLIFAVFVLFLSSAIGLLEINVISGLRVSVNSQVADNILILTYRISSLDTALFIIIGIALSVCLPVLGPVKSTLLTIIAIIVLYIIGKLSSNQYDLIPFEYFTLMILILYIVNILISYFIEIHSKQKILATFGQYLPPHIVNKISSGMEQLALEGEARQMTVLFCDIQSFTSISEELNPKQLSKLLNEYFTSLSKILFRYNATIDKFIGDSIMAFWGAPLEQDDQAERAVLCALDMIMEIERLSKNFRRRGWPGPAAGIGINSGLMAVGNMGSVYRMAYTVIGDAVNVASRAESLTRTYHVPIIVSDTTREKCHDILFREMDNVVLKGKRRSTRLFQPLCLRSEATPDQLEEIDKHNEALHAYYKKDFVTARSLFTDLASRHNDDLYYSMMSDKMSAFCLEDD